MSELKNTSANDSTSMAKLKKNLYKLGINGDPTNTKTNSSRNERPRNQPTEQIGSDATPMCKEVAWNSLNIKPSVATVLHTYGFKHPSPVQVKSIPHAIAGKDLLVRAWNGTGKTASFMVPILNKIDSAKGLQALVVVPNRELALQISKAFIVLSSDLGVRCMPAIGGTNLAEDVLRMTAGVHIIVGTPGRIDDLLNKKLCPIEEGLMLVFDEADKMLDSMFYKSVVSILSHLPASRQTLLYSATFPRSIEGFVSQNMRDPLKIRINNQSLKNIEQFFVRITPHTKIPCLKSLLACLDINQCIIYCNSTDTVKLLAEKITKMGMSAYFIYSTMNNDERNIVYHNFATNKCKILVSTDVTTRGIDVPGINVVINFDLPDSSESYQHRIGRAGRFGRRACAINLIHENERQLLVMYASSFGSSVLPVSDPSFKEHSRQSVSHDK